MNWKICDGSCIWFLFPPVMLTLATRLSRMKKWLVMKIRHSTFDLFYFFSMAMEEIWVWRTSSYWVSVEKGFAYLKAKTTQLLYRNGNATVKYFGYMKCLIWPVTWKSLDLKNKNQNHIQLSFSLRLKNLKYRESNHPSKVFGCELEEFLES